MNRTLRLFGVLLLLLGALAAPVRAHGSHAAIHVVDDRGTSITLASAPHRIISLAPNVTEILFALGLGPRVVGVSNFSNYPSAALKLPKVIDYTSVSLEKIRALQPDLIVAAAIVPQSAIDKLRSLQLPVLVTDPHDLQGIVADIRLVGVATDAVVPATKLVTSMQQRIASVAAKVAHASGHPRVFYEVDPTLYTVGHGSFVDALITMAGGVNVAGAVMNPYPQLSAEKVVAGDPQYIILSDAAYGTTAAKVAARPGWSAISAVKDHHIVAFNDDLASRPGPRIVQGLEVLARILHPELYR